MTFRRVKKLSRKEDYASADCASYSGAEGEIYKSSNETYKSGAETYKRSDLYKTLAYSGGTLPRNHKQRSLMKWKTLTDSPEHERRIIILEKQDGEAFGFEIQTYGLHHRDENAMEMCTFVCRVRENTPAQLGGLRQGDTITSINGTIVDGFRHRDIVDLIKSSGNCLRLETVYGTSIRRAELETRLQYLKQTLQEKWEEYRSLMVQEQRLVHDAGSEDSHSTHSNEVVLAKKALTRSVSAKAGHNGVASSSSSSWEKCNNQSAFGTLPRKSRRKSLRKRLLKYIPGLNRSVEEEESHL
ncbi:general receptor for phosphoinositides 1-associated scaffold protein isoform X2 [Heterodontus francisci]|uniref:general receptor for phosphoinositides 1-associated scaffold protein isoform X2 n=1 Tax=Heterodontus francisci TaxID=7792 RepID=UPI00355B4956